jgi:UDP-N-acetylmuramyl tripeptide synthase
MDGIIFELRLAGDEKQVHAPFLYEEYLYNLLAAVGACHALSFPFESIIDGIPRLALLPEETRSLGRASAHR